MSIRAGARSGGIRRIVVWGMCDTSKPRVRILLQGLRENGVEVIECRHDVWKGIDDKSQIKGALRWMRLLAGIALAYPLLVWRYLRLPAHDWVLLGYPAIPDIFVIRLFAWLRRTPVAMDWFLSAYDTVVEDRQLLARNHPLAWLLRAGEWLAVRLPDALFMDTRTHAQRMEAVFGLRAGRCGSVWVGAEDQAFAIAAHAPADREAPPLVVFYGQMIPLHGMASILEAARLLRDRPLDWLIIGRGQDADAVDGQLAKDPLPRVRRLQWVDYAGLAEHIARASLCLGIFGTSCKAMSVIPNKAFQIIASGKPLITMDSPAMRELVPLPVSDIALTPPGDARALADAIAAWCEHPPARDPGRDALVGTITPAAIGRQCLRLLEAAAP